MPGRKNDLRKNCTYENAIDMIMKAKELTSQKASSSRAQASPSSHLEQPRTSCGDSYAAFHDLLAKLLVDEFDEDKILPPEDGSLNPFLASLERMVADNPPVLSRAEESRMKAELATLQGWLEESNALIERKEKIQAQKNDREEEMLQLPGGNSNETAVQIQAPAPERKRPLPSISPTITDITVTVIESNLLAKVEQLAALISPDGKVKISKVLNDRTSHVIVGSVDENRLAQFRSKSFLLGILQGCWLVGSNWVEASLENGYLVDETEFEVRGVQGDVNLGGPERGRQHRALSYSHKDKTKQSLFGSMKIRLLKKTWPPEHSKNLEAVEKALLVGGAILVKEEDVDAPLTVVYATAGMQSSSRLPTDDQMGVNTVGYRWVFDSISYFELLDFDRYT